MELERKFSCIKLGYCIRKKHPYASIILIALVASLVGISIEYLVNRDFVSSGFWVTLFLVIGQMINVRIKIKYFLYSKCEILKWFLLLFCLNIGNIFSNRFSIDEFEVFLEEVGHVDLGTKQYIQT